MNKNKELQPVKHSHFIRQSLAGMTLLSGVFLLGFIPMWLKSRDTASRLDEAERHIRMTEYRRLPWTIARTSGLRVPERPSGKWYRTSHAVRV
jgi:hypothetical protein